LPHPHGHRNDARFNLLAWSTVRMDGDGYKQIDSLVEIVDVKQRSSVIHLKVNVDVEGSERRLSSLNESDERISAGSERRLSSLNESDERISAGSEASTASRNGT
ncbi:unnamed protein product, partial [Adineta ricciae]